MSTPETSSSSKSPTRYERYRPIVEHMVECETLYPEEVKRKFGHEQPAFVTRIVNELKTQGWLIREPQSDSYHWNSDKGAFSVSRWLDEKLYGSQIKLSPEQDRPRERLLAHGVEKLRTSELIAILVRSGRPGESAVTAGEKVARAFGQTLEKLPYAGRAELKSISPAVVKTAYCQIMAGIELGKRVYEAGGGQASAKITGSNDAIAFCQKHFSRLAADTTHEEFHIVTLDTKNKVIQSHQITVGTLDASLVHPREVFRAAIKDSAASVILVHNHPSGDPTPSREDIQVTDRLTESGKLLGIDVLDHIVLGRERAISIRAN
jgi:DNA repair protein RadC